MCERCEPAPGDLGHIPPHCIEPSEVPHRGNTRLWPLGELPGLRVRCCGGATQPSRLMAGCRRSTVHCGMLQRVHASGFSLPSGPVDVPSNQRPKRSSERTKVRLSEGAFVRSQCRRIINETSQASDLQRLFDTRHSHSIVNRRGRALVERGRQSNFSHMVPTPMPSNCCDFTPFILLLLPIILTT